jgi:hypothetical protein
VSDVETRLEALSTAIAAALTRRDWRELEVLAHALGEDARKARAREEEARAEAARRAEDQPARAGAEAALEAETREEEARRANAGEARAREAKAKGSQARAPSLDRPRWVDSAPEARVELAAADLLQAPSQRALHNWFVALDDAVRANTDHLPDWLRATSAVLANLHASPAFETPHRAWTPEDRVAVAAALRERVEQRLDAARKAAPNSEEVWRTAWLIERGAHQLVGDGLAWPRRAGVSLTPGLWRLLGERAAEAPGAHASRLGARALAALYSPWARPVAIWLTGERRPVARPLVHAETAAERRHVELVACLKEVEAGLARLEAGHATAWRSLSPHREAVRGWKPWQDRAEQAAHRWAEDLLDDELAAFVAGWREVLDSRTARTFHVNVGVALLARALDAGEVAPEEAEAQLADLAAIAPNNRAARALRARLDDEAPRPRGRRPR